ncbi:PhoU domain-containing protein [symbiont of Argiope bruennichi]|uniref:PhoU domain-containing protein n=1 Tax=symbiont of Argiope bruennichi TaxID=2810479 RepID=UPI003DA489E8
MKKIIDQELGLIKKSVINFLNDLIEDLEKYAVSIENNETERIALLIEQEKKINQTHDEIFEEIVWVISKESPVAKDLRKLMAYSNMAREIEKLSNLIRLSFEKYLNTKNLNLKIFKKYFILVFNFLISELIAISYLISSYKDELINNIITYENKINNYVQKASISISNKIYAESEKKNLETYFLLFYFLQNIERCGNLAIQLVREKIFIFKNRYIEIN